MHNRGAAVYVHSAGRILLLAQCSLLSIFMGAVILLSQRISKMEESAILQWKEMNKTVSLQAICIIRGI